MSEKLLPCPFCGSDQAFIRKEYDEHSASGGYFHAVHCGKCRASSGPLYASETCPIFYAEVRDAWNVRAAAAKEEV